jgi:hypothetical protein
MPANGSCGQVVVRVRHAEQGKRFVSGFTVFAMHVLEVDATIIIFSETTCLRR